MSQKRKCKHGATYFRFEMPLESNGVFIENLTVEGYGCIENRKPLADIDSVVHRGEDIKPVLEIVGGMAMIDEKAEEHVKELFAETQLQLA